MITKQQRFQRDAKRTAAAAVTITKTQKQLLGEIITELHYAMTANLRHQSRMKSFLLLQTRFNFLVR